MKKARVVTILGIVCVILAASLAGALMQYTSIVNAKDNTITNQDSTINELRAQIKERDDQISALIVQLAERDLQIQNLTNQNSNLQTWLEGNVSSLNAQIANLQNQIENLNSQVTTLRNQVNASHSQMRTLQIQASTDQSTIGNLQSQIATLNTQVSTLQNQSSTDQSTIANLQSQLSSANTQVSALNNRVAELQNQLSNLEEIININNSNLQTLAFHVCEKNWVHISNVTDIYRQITALDNNTHNVLLLPEYKEHQNWTQELAWLTSTFGGPQGIPLMLEVFGSGSGTSPTPMLSTVNISAALATCNVKYLRFSEVISWHMEHNQSFPADYVKSILEFCRANDLKLFWTEWKTEVYSTIQTSIKGYEDIVTVSFSTNSEECEPVAGCMQVSGLFQHWGASIQAWYWTTYHGEDLQEMPNSLLVQHALSATNIGAEILEFEPYWYFFENGQTNDNLTLLLTMLT